MTATQQQTLAAICATCPHHIDGHERPSTWRTERRMAVCEVNTNGERGGRVPIPVRLTMGMCPIGKFPKAERAPVAGDEVASECGCKKAPPKTTHTGASVVMWPRWAEKRRMWRMDDRTKRPVSATVWKVAPAGVAWYGLPMPLRWWIVLRYGIVRDYPGCGCLVALKKFAPWLDAPLGLLEHVRIGVVAPLAVWWHSRWLTVQTPTGRKQVENPAWQPVPGADPKAAAWVLLVLLVVFVALVGSVVA